MCMKTKDEKSDILEGPRMLMKNKQLNKLSCRLIRGRRKMTLNRTNLRTDMINCSTYSEYCTGIQSLGFILLTYCACKV